MIPEDENFWIPTTITESTFPDHEVEAFVEEWEAVSAYVCSKIGPESLPALFPKEDDAARSVVLPHNWITRIPMSFIDAGRRSATFSQMPSDGYLLPQAKDGSQRWLVVQAVYDRPTRSISTVYIGVVGNGDSNEEN